LYALLNMKEIDKVYHRGEMYMDNLNECRDVGTRLDEVLANNTPTGTQFATQATNKIGMYAGGGSDVSPGVRTSNVNITKLDGGDNDSEMSEELKE
jgi:hypothetical protein